jgi:hypothetical protein
MGVGVAASCLNTLISCFIESLALRAEAKLKPRLTAAAVRHASGRLYVAAGTLVGHWSEGLGWVDAVCRACVTITTIGHGDMTPCWGPRLLVSGGIQFDGSMG